MDSVELNVRKLLGIALIAASACSGDPSKKTPVPDSATAVKTPAATAATYVGVAYDPLPEGTSYEGGTVLTGPDGKPTSWLLSNVLTPRGHMMWLDSILPTDGVIRHRVIRAEVVIPPVRPGERVMIGTCDLDKKLDPAIVAIAEDEQIKKLTKIHQAWRANTKTGTFDMLPLAGITCENPDRI